MQLSDVNLVDLERFQRSVPHEMFAVLRREAPVFWQDEPGGPGYWAITKYEDVKAISRNPGLFSSARRGALVREPDAHMLEVTRKIMLNMDPPQHRQYRNLVNKAFTPRMINALHHRIQELVGEIIDGVIERGTCDFVEDVAAQLPMLAICEMMGVPAEDRTRIYNLGNQMIGFDDPELQPDGSLVNEEQKNDEAFGEMFMYATKLRDRALAEPRDDLATGLVHAELDGEKLSEEEFQFFFLLLLVAGNETTRTVTSNGMLTLLDHPDQLAELRREQDLLPSAVEEILRFAPAVHCFRRQTMAATEIRGQAIAENAKVVVWYPSANRDEEIFDDAQTFDIHRKADHLAFGVGEHFCLGANLARMELQEIFRGITQRMHDIELVAPPRRLRSNFINGVKEAQIRFRTGPRLT